MEPYELLEQEFAAWIGRSASRTVVCSSGTAALQLAIEATQLPKASEVIVPDFTMIACARAVSMAGLSPKFVDCKTDLLLDETRLEQALTPDTTAIMAVHVYGRKCAMQSIHRFAKQHDLIVIEDLAEAHGISMHPLTHVGCWSFYRNKIVAGEEGGVAVFRHSTDADLARSQRCMGFTPEHNFTHHPGGFNARMSNCHAQLIRNSLKSVYEHLIRRKIVTGCYDKAVPKLMRMPHRESPWVYDFLLPDRAGLLQSGDEVFEFDVTHNETIVAELAARGVPARVGFKPMSSQPEYQIPHPLSADRDSCATEMSNRVVYLPIEVSESDWKETTMRRCAILTDVLRLQNWTFSPSNNTGLRHSELIWGQLNRSS